MFLAGEVPVPGGVTPPSPPLTVSCTDAPATDATALPQSSGYIALAVASVGGGVVAAVTSNAQLAMDNGAATRSVRRGGGRVGGGAGWSGFRGQSLFSPPGSQPLATSLPPSPLYTRRLLSWRHSAGDSEGRGVRQSGRGGQRDCWGSMPSRGGKAAMAVALGGGRSRCASLLRRACGLPVDGCYVRGEAHD